MLNMTQVLFGEILLRLNRSSSIQRVLHRSNLSRSFFSLILWIQTLVGNVCEFACKILLWSCDLIMGDLDVITDCSGIKTRD
jgi:hypothetical protein